MLAAFQQKKISMLTGLKVSNVYASAKMYLADQNIMEKRMELKFKGLEVQK